MLLAVVVTKDELVALVEAITPLRVTIDERRGRAVTLGRPRAVYLVPDHGLRVRGDARIVWDVAGVGITIAIPTWQMMLVPQIAARGRSRVLAFDPIVEALEMKLVPGFLDGKIADVLRDGIAQSRRKLAWDFSRTLSKRLTLPARIGPTRLFEIAATDGTVTVTDREVRLTVTLEARVEKPETAKSQDGGPRAGAPATARAVAR
jgi:hypothetical protein